MRVRRIATLCLLCGLLSFPSSNIRADWPQLRGGPRHTGFTAQGVALPLRLAWAVEFENERLGTAMEPVVAAGSVFIATHAGNLYALDAETGEPRWRFAAARPFPHSPAIGSGIVVTAGAGDAGVWGIDAATGAQRWSFLPAESRLGGFAASPLVAEDQVFLGSRSGEFFCLRLRDGKVLWRAELGVPIRQTAATDGRLVFVTGENLRVRGIDIQSGRIVWTTQLQGQSARDYAPVVVEAGGRTYVVIRTNPTLNMAQRIARDRSLLARNAGADDTDWRKLDAWIKSDASRGTSPLWAKEQEVVEASLRAEPGARTFFVLDAATGQETGVPPVLWLAGCQGVGAPPALTARGGLLVLHRSAYGNWNHGVAPLVALGLLDLARNRIEPLFHARGAQPPWNTFWGTADESHNFTVAGDLVLIAHQGTLSGFDLATGQLSTIHGERDTFGGFRNPPWARNEWHGPARGGVAVAGGRVFWITGSRVLCLAGAGRSPPTKLRTIRSADVAAAGRAPAAPSPDLRPVLTTSVHEALAQSWAPMWVEPGLAGREFFYSHSSDAFAALAWAYPHLDAGQQAEVRKWLAAEWAGHPPFSPAGAYDLRAGARREYHAVPDEEMSRLGFDKPPHPFGGMYAVWLYAVRLGESNRVSREWPRLQASFADWRKLGWRLDGARGDRYANRYLGALLAFANLAEAAGEAAVATDARTKAAETHAELVAWWQRAAQEGTLGSFDGASGLDPFIGGGDALSFKIAPHRHKLALFLDLTPEMAAQIRAAAPEAVAAVWSLFERLYSTWWLVGEERQVHFGENYLDPPDLAFGAFTALAWLRQPPVDELRCRLDIPFTRGDFYHVTKTALVLEAAGGR